MRAGVIGSWGEFSEAVKRGGIEFPDTKKRMKFDQKIKLENFVKKNISVVKVLK